MAVLIQQRGSKRQRRFDIADGRCVLGRQPDCDVSDVFADNPAVSRRHTQVSGAGDRYFVEDLGSRNGTLLNGNPITGRTPLAEGDRLEIGGVAFRFFSEPSHVSPDAGRSAGDEAGPSVDDEPTVGLMREDERQSIVLSTCEVSFLAGAAEHWAAHPERKLRALVHLLANLGNSLEPETVLRNLLAGLFEVFPQADRGFVGLTDPNEARVVPRAVRTRDGNGVESVPVSRTIIQRVTESKEAILSADAQTDPRFRDSQSITGGEIRSMMCAPLVDAEGTVLGVVQIDTRDMRREFDAEDLEVLASIAPQAATALSYCRCYEEALRRQSLDRDLDVARRVQAALLPDRPPSLEGYQFFAYYEAAFQVGGDLYDYVPLPDRRWAVVVADAAGKGVSAALLMAKLCGELRTYLAIEPSPSDAVARMNDSMIQGGLSGRSVTLVVAVIDPADHSVRLVNAGHVAPLVRRANGFLDEAHGAIGGPALGTLPDQSYQERRLRLGEGDAVVVLTDGISGAVRATGETYGMERLRAQVATPVGTAREVGERVLGDVRQFVGGHAQSDDICLLCFGRNG